jgi:hypothetical protein
LNQIVQRRISNCLAQRGVGRVNAEVKELEGGRMPRARLPQLADTLRQAEHELAEAAHLNPSNQDIERALRELRELMKRILPS